MFYSQHKTNAMSEKVAKFDANDLKYTPLRKVIMSKVNPHNVPCLYKKCFERHAVESLIKCSGDNDMFAYTINEGTDEDEEYRTMQTVLSNMPALDLTGWSEKAETSSGDGQAGEGKFTPNDIYEAVAINLVHPSDPETKNVNQLAPWSVCRLCHLPYMDQKFLQQHNKRLQNDGLCETPRWTPRLNHATLLRQKANVEPKKPGTSFGRWASHGLIDNGEASTHGNMGIVRSKRPVRSAGSHIKKVSCESTPTGPCDSAKTNLADCQDSVKPRSNGGPYNFRHSRNVKSYIKEYREQVTRPNLIRASSSQKQISPKSARQPVPKASVECTDVRDGACVRPTIKVSNFDFQVDAMYTGRVCTRRSHTRPQSGASTCSSTCSSPSKMFTEGSERIRSGRRSGCESPGKGEQGGEEEEEEAGEKRPLNQGRPGQWMRSMLISRSRPSIPSNAKGTICPTAVETPIHVLPCNNRFGGRYHAGSGTGNVLVHTNVQTNALVAAYQDPCSQLKKTYSSSSSPYNGNHQR